MTATIVDTNVGVVANGLEQDVSPGCVIACTDLLQEFTAGSRQLVLDDSRLILDEYMKNMSSTGQPGVGDAFLKWVLRNQANPTACDLVGIQPVEGRGFSEFPDDPDLIGFDPDDRKFVAVCLASDTNPPIANAVDSDWWLFREPLQRHGVQVEQLCPEREPLWQAKAGSS